MATLLAVAALAIVADQVTKAMARASLAPGNPIVLVPGFFELSFVRNTGAAFGLMAGQRLLFIGISLLVLAGIAWVWNHYHPTAWYSVLALGLVAGGAVGNLIDRAATGQVTDFLYVHWIPVFNVADSCIVVGVSILVVWLLLMPDDAEPADGAHDDDGSAGDDQADDPPLPPDGAER